MEVDRRLRLSATTAGGGGDGGGGDVYCLGDIAAVEGLDLACNAQVGGEACVRARMYVGNRERPFYFLRVYKRMCVCVFLRDAVWGAAVPGSALLGALY